MLASRWAATVEHDGAGDRVRLQVRLSDAPFLVERAVSLAHGRCEVRLEERVTNEGDHPVEYMGHHPRSARRSSPRGPGCATSAAAILADAEVNGAANPFEPGTSIRGRS